MICPKCKHTDTRVLDSRETNEHREIRRRRHCEKCQFRFTTFERFEPSHFIVVKKDGARETYNRQKIENGIWKACEKRPITKDQIDRTINELEEQLAASGQEVSSDKIGQAIMEKLRSLDEVAYIRFASVYRHFKDIETFQKELQKLLDS